MAADGNAAPHSIGRYRLMKVLGAGGMATVHLARLSGERGFERLYAVKCCHPQYEEDESFAAMFLDEARLAARIHHPNIVSTLDFGTVDGRTFLVMDYVEGVRALDLMRRAAQAGTALPIAITLRIVCDVLEGLHAAHELTTNDGAPLEVVHRDVSPHNVLVGLDGSSRVIDFGIAKAAERAAVTQHGLLKGKIGYMSPEQLVGEDVDRRTDVFAVGVVMWELLVGRRLFSGPSREDVVRRVLDEPIPEPSLQSPAPEAKLDAVVVRALERDRDRRFSTAVEMVDAIERSGVRIATAREVGAYVDERFGDEIRERRRVPEESTSPSTATPATAAPIPAGNRLLVAVGLASVAAAALAGAATWWALQGERGVDDRARDAPPPAAEVGAPTELDPDPAEPRAAAATTVDEAHAPEPPAVEAAPSDDRPTVSRRSVRRRRAENEPAESEPAESDPAESDRAREGPRGAWFPSGP